MTTLLSAGMSDRSFRSQRSRQLFDDMNLSAKLPHGSSGVSQSTHARLPAAEAVECPKCSKRSVVRRSSNIFDCINCSFHKELPPVAPSLSSARFSRSSLPVQSLPVQSLLSHQRSPHVDLHLEEEMPNDKTHPLVFAALMVIIGILFL